MKRFLALLLGLTLAALPAVAQVGKPSLGNVAGPSTTPSSELRSIITDETGTGPLVFGNSPTLTAPDLGTPSAAVLTNATGLPVSTGLHGLGTGVATFLATPSSANLAAAISDETGTGALVFAGSPTFTGTILAANATLSGALNIGAGNAFGWSGRSLMASPTNGNIALFNNAGTSFGLLQFGGLTSSFPAIKRSGATLQARLADDSNYAGLAVAGLTATELNVASGALDLVNLPSHQWSFIASGGTYLDNNIYLQNTTTNGVQCGNAALWSGNAQDGNQIGALFGNMTSTVCGNSLGAVELAYWKIGLGDIGDASAQRFNYRFALNVTNNADSLYFPSVSYDPLVFNGADGFFTFYDHLSRPAFFIDTEGHSAALQGVRNQLTFYGGATAGAPMVIGAGGTDTDVGITIAAKNNEAIILQTNGYTAARFANGSTPSLVNYINVTGAVAGNPPAIVAGGPATDIPLSLWAKNNSYVALISRDTTAFRALNPSASAVNYAYVYGAPTGQSVTFGGDGTDTNVSVVLAAKAAGAVYAYSNDQPVFAAYNSGTGYNRYLIFNGSNGGNPTINVSAGSLAITPDTVFAGKLGIGIAPTYALQSDETTNGVARWQQTNQSTGGSAAVMFAQGAGGRFVFRDVTYSSQAFKEYGSTGAIVIRYSDFDYQYIRNTAGTAYLSITPSGASFAAGITGTTAGFSGAVTGLTFNGATITSTTGTYTLASGKTFTVSNTLTLTGTDGSTLAIGGGGTLGTAAYKNTGTSGNTVPLLDGANTWSSSQAFAAASFAGNVKIYDAGYFYTSFNGGSDTGAVRAGVQMDGANQGVNFYTANTYRGSVLSDGRIYWSYAISAAATSGYQLDGTTIFTGPGNYIVLKDRAGTNDALALGNSSDPANYYQNTSHIFRSINGAATYATLNSTGLGVGTSPSYKLHVAGTGFITGSTSVGTAGSSNVLTVGGTNNTNAFIVTNSSGAKFFAISPEVSTDVMLMGYWTGAAFGRTDIGGDLNVVNYLGLGNTAPSTYLDINGDKYRVRTAKTPSSASDTCNQGDHAWDASYFYLCTAANTWRRTAHATW